MELQLFLNEHLPAIVRREVRDALADTKKNGSTENTWFRRKEFLDIHNISSSTLDRRVFEGSIEKDLSFGPRSPRYRLKQVKRK